jgi:hypothetical protein
MTVRGTITKLERRTTAKSVQVLIITIDGQRIKAFGPLAKTAGIEVGSVVRVTGREVLRAYQSKGKRVTVKEVLADGIDVV